MELKIYWDKDSEQYLLSLPERFRKGLLKSLKIIGPIARDSAKKQFGGPRQLKIRSGTLRQSIESGVETKGGETYAYIGSDVIYAATHEYGDHRRNIPERPYLEPGVRQSLDKMIRAIESEVVYELEK